MMLVVQTYVLINYRTALYLKESARFPVYASKILFHHVAELDSLAVLARDGIGTEVIDQALKVTQAISDKFGHELNDEHGSTGSMGMLPSASIGVHTSVFEPIHGSYPQAAGKDIANPLATVLSAAMMFEYAFNLMEEGKLIREAVNASLAAEYVTEDITEGTAYKTSEVGDWLANYIANK